MMSMVAGCLNYIGGVVEVEGWCQSKVSGGLCSGS